MALWGPVRLSVVSQEAQAFCRMEEYGAPVEKTADTSGEVDAFVVQKVGLPLLSTMRVSLLFSRKDSHASFLIPLVMLKSPQR